MYKELEIYKTDMIDIIKNKYKLDGAVQSEIGNLDFYFSKEPTEQMNIMYEPSLCVILQGEKAVGFGDETLSYNTEEFLIASTHLPAKMKIIKASKEKPYMSLRIKFELEDIFDLLKTTKLQEEKLDKNASQGLYFGKMNSELYESIYRLILLLKRDKEDIEYLAPLLTKEVLYNLVKSKGGTFLRKFSQIGTNSNKITHVITQIKENFNEKLNIKELADSVDMSESSLYNHFKIITTMSPIQFQKNLRLEEAKQLLMFKDIEISEAAYQVGYESPSQFSREFSRMFGMSPKGFVLNHQKSS
jgi:AraC-like DNA-binding protein